MAEFYITFGQSHVHRIQGETMDADCVAVITSPTHAEARVVAFDLFGVKFCTSYAASDFTAEDMAYYPRGLIHVN